MIVRVAALLLGLALASLMVTSGLLLTVRVLFPEWYAVPGELLHMTGQKVAPEVVAPSLPTMAPPPADTTAPVPTALPAAAETPASGAPERHALGPLLPNRRFNVLLLGSDNDLKFASNAVLTQAIILISIDPTGPDVAMISIPRDFWVPISNYGYQKIDVAYEAGGITLARSTIERLFGLHIDYYAWVGLNGLVHVIDTLGGVDVTVQHPILDEMYPDDLNSSDPYAYFRLYIPAGPQHLDGTTALQYVRSRHGDLLSDFGRSQRQQQVLMALKDRVQTRSLVGRLPQLVAALDGSVVTDLSLPAIVELAGLARRVPPGNIHRQVLSAPEFASLGYSPDGTQQVVFPDWTAIRRVLSRLLLSAPASTSAVTSGA